jgi:hypothetical protein
MSAARLLLSLAGTKTSAEAVEQEKLFSLSKADSGVQASGWEFRLTSCGEVNAGRITAA